MVKNTSSVRIVKNEAAISRASVDNVIRNRIHSEIGTYRVVYNSMVLAIIPVQRIK